MNMDRKNELEWKLLCAALFLMLILKQAAISVVVFSHLFILFMDVCQSWGFL